jgi:arylsulfatase A-like enzyme
MMRDNKPNFIIVMTDQQRADLRRSCGCPLDTMPFLDEWASEGVDFERAYTPNPACMPARVSMFTGRYSQTHHVRTNHNREDAFYTEDLLDIMKQNGYRTAICGKNHSHHDYEEFDFHRKTDHLGRTDRNLTEKEQAFSDYLNQTRFVDSTKPAPGGADVQHPYKNVSDALDFIDEVGGKTPFFAWISIAEPHNPYQVPSPYFDMFPPEELPICVTASEAQENWKGSRFTRLRKAWEQVYAPEVDEHILRSRSNYFGMLRLIDDQLRRLMEGIKERELEENTIIIYLSDHGDFVGEYGLMRKGADLSELLTHIPMIWKGPGITATGKETKAFANIVDILPTICDMIGVTIPIGVQGKSLLPILQGKTGYEREFNKAYMESGFSGLYWEDEDELDYQAEGATVDMSAFDCLNTWTQCGQVRSLRMDHYRIQTDMMGDGYLYDLSKDPMELYNLWEHSEYSSAKAMLLQELIASMLQNSDVFPVPHHRYRTKIHPKGYWYQEYTAPDPGVHPSGTICEIFYNRKRYHVRRNTSGKVD